MTRRLLFVLTGGFLVGCHLALPLEPVHDAWSADLSAADTQEPVDADRLDHDRDAPYDPADLVASDSDAGIGCAAIAHEVMRYSPTMITCRHNDNTVDGLCSPTSNPCVTQCTAGSLCAPGWHLCTAADFRARGGAGTPATIRAWVGGCVRDGASVVAPQPGPCSQCVAKALAIEYDSWGCGGSGSAAGNNEIYMGVLAGKNCWRVGADEPQYEAFWQTYPAYHGQAASVCCL